MLRSKVPQSMQKTYDECYLICSTAVYFEGQNDEAEALRQWRAALDRIYYLNAFKISPDWKPRSETEKTLQESLRNLELQCKERVELLEALKKSRDEANGDSERSASIRSARSGCSSAKASVDHNTTQGWIGEGTIPPADLGRTNPTYNTVSSSSSGPSAHLKPPTPARPSLPHQSSSASMNTVRYTQTLSPPANLAEGGSRSSSPEKRNVLRTTLRSSKDGKRNGKTSLESTLRKPPAASKAAGLAWDAIQRNSSGASISTTNSAQRPASRAAADDAARRASSELQAQAQNNRSYRPLSPPPVPKPEVKTTTRGWVRKRPQESSEKLSVDMPPVTTTTGATSAPKPPPHASLPSSSNLTSDLPLRNLPSLPSYRQEYAPQPVQPVQRPPSPPSDLSVPSTPETSLRRASPAQRPRVPPPVIPRKPTARAQAKVSDDDSQPARPTELRPRASKPKATTNSEEAAADSAEQNGPEMTDLEKRLAYIKKNLPKGVDEAAAKQIFNEIVVQGDEVHWDDVSGLDVAKKALKEAVVYPFLRPDLFLGLREPARGMLLFGPPGTGKTMLARAVATESKSTFFAISASSLTSKWLGESEKLVRALFQLAKALAPSIIFVDEIDSLLSSRGGNSEHESTRRIKTEFLIQWSDLQKAAAGREQSDKDKKEGDASRVLVLAATNLPWAIDEAARRRFVRRQYIPLPEDEVRAQQLRILLGHQKHSLSARDIQKLVELTDGFSGSDITALAKDAAMGPLRSLGEALLSMTMDQIRPIQFQDFQASLTNIRPSVSKAGLKEFEDWAREFGERGG